MRTQNSSASRYHLGTVIQQGAYGKVYNAVDTETGKRVAIKQVPKAKISMYEADILGSCQHASIVRLLDSFTTKNALFLVMELCDGGELFDRITERLDEKTAANIVRQILQGVAYFHRHDIVHGDLKLSNIMLHKQQVKIIDFGMAQRVKSAEQLSEFVGSPGFSAPEVWAGAYTKACDLWSVGCITFAMLCRFNPFNPSAYASVQEISANIQRGFHPEVRSGYGAWFPRDIPLSAEAQDFITSLLTLDWRSRMTAEEALRHKWLLTR